MAKTTDSVTLDEAPKRSPNDLRRIARYQRWLIAVVLAQMALWGGFLALTIHGNSPVLDSALPRMLLLILGSVGGIYVFLLTWELRDGVIAIVFGFATVIPFMGILVMILANTYASEELRKYGIPVGIFGANDDDIANPPASADTDADADW
jgi:hypothetical protein